MYTLAANFSMAKGSVGMSDETELYRVIYQLLLNIPQNKARQKLTL